MGTPADGKAERDSLSRELLLLFQGAKIGGAPCSECSFRRKTALLLPLGPEERDEGKRERRLLVGHGRRILVEDRLV